MYGKVSIPQQIKFLYASRRLVVSTLEIKLGVSFRVVPILIL